MRIMKKIGRNDSCPCGSEKKYKNCYILKNENCTLFIKEEHESREKKVIEFLTKTSEEINYSIGNEVNGNPRIPQRARLSLIFVLVDILAVYWDKYCGFNNKESTYFKNWVSKFCLIDKNDAYVQSDQYTSDDLYKLRNSILHFYGVPRTSEGVNYILVPDSSTIKKLDVRPPDDFLKALSVNLPAPNRVVRIEIIKKLVWSGSILMLNSMKSYLNNNPREHMAGMKRIFQEVQDRGVALVEIKKNK